MAEYTAPKLSQLSAHDYEKIKKSLGKYRAGPQYQTYTNSDRFKGKRTIWDPVADKKFRKEQEEPRASFKRGDYGIEDEYRYMISKGFRPESMQVAPQVDTPVEEPQTGYTPTPLPTDINGPQEPQPQEPQGPDFAALFAEQIASMQQMFQQSMQQQQQQYMQMQQAQDERMAALQQQMQQSMIAQQQRPEVAGVKMAEGTGGTPMQIARRGVTGAFGRRGMRISSLNV